jgi:hypothetical protein
VAETSGVPLMAPEQLAGQAKENELMRIHGSEIPVFVEIPIKTSNF